MYIIIRMYCSSFGIWLEKRHNCRWSTMRCTRTFKWMTPTPTCLNVGRVWCRLKPNCTKVSRFNSLAMRLPYSVTVLTHFHFHLHLHLHFCSAGTSLWGAEHWCDCGRWWQCIAGHEKESDGVIERIVHWQCAGSTARHRGQQWKWWWERQCCCHQAHPLKRSSG